jgi:hypothetical protein
MSSPKDSHAAAKKASRETAAATRAAVRAKRWNFIVSPPTITILTDANRCEAKNGRIGQSVLRCFRLRGHDGEHVY